MLFIILSCGQIRELGHQGLMQDFLLGRGGGRENCMDDMYAECQICVRSLLYILLKL